MNARRREGRRTAPDAAASERLQAAVLGIAQAAATAASLPDLLRAVHQVVEDLMPARNLYVALHDPVSDLITFPYYVDENDPAPEPRHPRRGMTEYVLRTGQPLLAVPELYPELERRGEIEILGTDSVDWLGAPISVGDQTIGVIAVQTYTEGVRYTESEKIILQFVSTQVAGAIERRRAEDALRESEERYRRLVESGPDAMLLFAAGRAVYGNPACARLLGLPAPDAVVGRDILEFIPAAQHARVADLLGQLQRREGSLRPEELQLTRADGTTVDVEVVGIPVPHGGGEAIQVVMRDITERKRADAQLRLLGQAVKSTREAISLTDLDGRFTFANRAFLEDYGYTEEEVLGHSVEIIDSPRNPPDVRARVDPETLAGGWSGELWNRRKDGSEFLVFLRTSTVVDAEGRAIGLMGVSEDITALKASEAKYRELVESAPVGIYRSTEDGRFLSANGTLAAMLGYDSVEELTRRRVSDVYADPAEREALIARYRTTGATDVEARWKRKDGTPLRVLVDAQPVMDATGEVLHFEVFVRDMTARAHLEDQLRQAQKMEAVGQLAGGVAHDFNNLLTAILGFSSTLLDEEELQPAHRRDLEEIRDAATRAATLTQQLLAFSRRQVLQPEELRLSDVVTGVEQLLRRLLGEHIDLRVAADERGEGLVVADRGQIEQVIVNLAVNARDAMPQGGVLTIETTRTIVDEAMAARKAELPAGPYLVLAVSDSGSGMDEATRGRIFEPFFTTKSQGEGTGLGLATVYGIMQQSGGHVTVYSEPGHGSTFRVYLPEVAAAGRDDAPVASAPAPAGRGSETVLLVEDEPAVRSLVRHTLERHGYSVIEAGHGAEALDLAAAHAGTIHLLLTDVVMPGMSGRELAERLGALRPDMKILYTSGYTEGAIDHHGVLDAGVAYLAKPYRPSALRAKVREVLDAG